MSYVRIVDIELAGYERYDDTLELKINGAISKEHPVPAVDVKVIDIEKIPEFEIVRYKVLILFRKEK